MAKKTPSPKKITVVIADDQTLFREGIKDLLENEKKITVIGDDDGDFLRGGGLLGHALILHNLVMQVSPR